MLTTTLLTTAHATADAPEALDASSAEVIEYDEHITVLASPFMEGRLPGTAGMERAKDYMEMYFVAAGLEPAFGDEHSAGRSFRQPFELGGTVTYHDQALHAETDDADLAFAEGDDFVMSGYGTSGDVTGEIVFVGYSIDSERREYTSFPEDIDLSGRIAVMYRFEPMDEEGNSLWSTRGPWSGAAGFNGKLRTVAKYNPAAIIVINTPGANDERVDRPLSSRGGEIIDTCPVFMMSKDAGTQLLEAADDDGRTALELRRHADEGGAPIEMSGCTLTVRGEKRREPVFAENVGGLLPGRGALADEIVVIGAHLDHLGMGEFGSRTGPGELHPGADDNASGSAAIIMLAQDLADDYANLDDDAEARTILFMGFSAEESGLNGSRYYVDNPIRPLDDHAMMINFDMIGRIVDNRLSISGLSSGVGLQDWVADIAQDSVLTVNLGGRAIGASDHSSFYRRDIPVMFGAIDGLHGDYHTPADTSDKINRVGAAETVRLFRHLLYGVATRTERFEYQSGAIGGRGGGGGGGNANRGGGGGGGATSAIKVRIGLRPADAPDDVKGVQLLSVTRGGPAESAGLQEGDVLTKLDKIDIPNLQAMLEQLATYEPGDEVHVTAMRDGVEKVFMVKLVAREG